MLADLIANRRFLVFAWAVLTLNQAHSTDPGVLVTLGEVEFGIVLVDYDRGPGSNIRKRYDGVKRVVEHTARIPFDKSIDWGFSMRVYAEGAKTIQLLTVWTDENGKIREGNSSLTTVRSGSRHQGSYYFGDGEGPGTWVLQVYLVGTDTPLQEIKMDDSVELALIFEQEFEMYDRESETD